MWEELYNDGLNSVHLKDNKIIVQNENERIYMKVYKSKQEAIIEAGMLSVLLEANKKFG